MGEELKLNSGSFIEAKNCLHDAFNNIQIFDEKTRRMNFFNVPGCIPKKLLFLDCLNRVAGGLFSYNVILAGRLKKMNEFQETLISMDAQNAALFADGATSSDILIDEDEMSNKEARKLGVKGDFFGELYQAGERINRSFSGMTSAVLSGDTKAAFAAIGDYAATIGSTAAVVTTSVTSGALSIVEAVIDGVSVVGTGILSIGTGLADLFTGGKNQYTKNMWEKEMDFVATDYVKKANDWFYEDTEIGKSINENSALKYDGAVASGIQTATKVVGEVVISVFTGGIGAAVFMGTAALGSAAQKEYQKEDRKAFTLEMGLATAAGAVAGYGIGSAGTIYRAARASGATVGNSFKAIGTTAIQSVKSTGTKIVSKASSVGSKALQTMGKAGTTALQTVKSAGATVASKFAPVGTFIKGLVPKAFLGKRLLKTGAALVIGGVLVSKLFQKKKEEENAEPDIPPVTPTSEEPINEPTPPQGDTPGNGNPGGNPGGSPSGNGDNGAGTGAVAGALTGGTIGGGLGEPGPTFTSPQPQEPQPSEKDVKPPLKEISGVLVGKTLNELMNDKDNGVRDVENYATGEDWNTKFVNDVIGRDEESKLLMEDYYKDSENYPDPYNSEDSLMDYALNEESNIEYNWSDSSLDKISEHTDSERGESYTPQEGDIIFLDTDESDGSFSGNRNDNTSTDRVGIIESVTTVVDENGKERKMIVVIEGDGGTDNPDTSKVVRKSYYSDSDEIIGYGTIKEYDGTPGGNDAGLGPKPPENPENPENPETPEPEIDDGSSIVLKEGDTAGNVDEGSNTGGTVDYDGVQRDSEGSEIGNVDLPTEDDGSVTVDVTEDLPSEDVKPTPISTEIKDDEIIEIIDEDDGSYLEFDPSLISWGTTTTDDNNNTSDSII